MQQIPNWKEATEQLKELRQRWIKVGGVENELTEGIETEFQAFYDDFYERKKQFHDTKMAMASSRINQYKAVLKLAKQLNENKQLTAEQKSIEADKLIAQWKALERIPKVKYDELLNQFKRFTNSKAIKGSNKHGQSSDKKGEKEKLALLEKLIEAQKLPSAEAIEIAKTAQEAWKALGKVYIDKKKSQAFFDIKDYIFEKNFLNTLFERKVKKNLAPKESIKAKMNLVRDLINRDKHELLVFEENMGKFKLDSAKADKLVGGKYERQQKKLAIKEQLLNELREENRDLK